MLYFHWVHFFSVVIILYDRQALNLIGRSHNYPQLLRTPSELLPHHSKAAYSWISQTSYNVTSLSHVHHTS